MNRVTYSFIINIFQKGMNGMRLPNGYGGVVKLSTPHCCRHTCISMLADARIDQTTIKKIVGHSGAMTLTEKVYTHMDVNELIKAINMI